MLCLDNFELFFDQQSLAQLGSLSSWLFLWPKMIENGRKQPKKCRKHSKRPKSQKKIAAATKPRALCHSHRRCGEALAAVAAAAMAAAPKRPAVGEPADSPTPAVKRLRDEESAQAAPEPEIRTIDYGQITAGMAGGGWLTTIPRQITPRQEKLFATLFSAVAFVSVVSGTVMPVTPPTGTRQLAEAETLGIYSNAHDDRLLVGVGDWRRAGARDLDGRAAARELLRPQPVRLPPEHERRPAIV